MKNINDTVPRMVRSRVTLAQEAEVALREEIHSGRLPPEARVNVDEAAARFSMSQIPVREALRGLVAVGLVDFVPQRGFTVSASSVDDALDTYRLRELLDPMAAELSVPKLRTEDLEAAQAALDAMARVDGPESRDERRPLHHDFHFALYRRCDSPWLLRILDMLWDNCESYERLSSEAQVCSFADRMAEHQAILAAAASGDGKKTGDVIRAHIEQTRALVVQAMTASS